MGMSIKEAIPILHDMYNYYNDVDVDAYVGFDNDDNNAIETALETMRKYQKIEQIINEYKQEGWTRVFIDDLEEAIEDGNVDCN